VRAAFIPFGEIINIEIPPDYENPAKHRGFAFIEYELAEDASAAIDNMVLKGCCCINIIMFIFTSNFQFTE
jgi:RNA recognition motif-containing protein